MTRLLHIGASPRGGASESLQIAATFLDAYRELHPDDEVEVWDLWDGSLPEFGPAAAGAKMTVFGGAAPGGEQAAAWQAAEETFRRLDAAERLLFSVPMWNAGVPYILKQLIDVVSQPGMILGVDPQAGYSGLLAGRGKKAAVIYSSAVWGRPWDRSSGATSNRRSSRTGCAGPGSRTSPRSAFTLSSTATPRSPAATRTTTLARWPAGSSDARLPALAGGLVR